MDLLLFRSELAGMFMWPGYPLKPRYLVSTKDDVQMAKRCMNSAQNPVRQKGSISEIFERHFSIVACLCPKHLHILFFNSGAGGSAYSLFLKSIYPADNQIAKVNNLTSAVPAIGIGFVIIIWRFIYFRSRWFISLVFYLNN